jgi:uncharacterized protein YjbJ (UPF0337 family)
MDNDRIKGAAEEMGGRIQNASSGVADYAKSQAKGLSAKAEGSIENGYARAKDAARNVSDSASSLAADAYDRSGQYLRDGNRLVARQVRDNALSALLLAGAAGYLLSYIVHARH